MWSDAFRSSDVPGVNARTLQKTPRENRTTHAVGASKTRRDRDRDRACTGSDPGREEPELGTGAMDDERMIQEVQYHSLIYDTTHPFYKDNSRKERAWAEVAAALRSDVNECKARWRNLRDTFVKHRKRLGLPNGGGGWPQKDWKYAELMSFLLPFVVPRVSKRRRPPSEAEGEQSSAPLSPVPSPPLDPSQTPPLTPAQGLWVDQPRRSRSPRDRAPSWAGQRQRVPESDWDEAYHFCLSTVPQLQRLSWRRRNTAKIEILGILERLREEQEQQPPRGPRRVHRAVDPPSRAASQGPGEQRRSESDQYQQLFQELFLEDGSFRRLLGLSRGQFDDLLCRVGESLTLQDTNYRRSIPASLRLSIGLRYLRSGNHFHSIAETFHVALSSVCKIVPQVVAALWDGLKADVLPQLGPERWRSVAEEFRQRWDFPLCCGALDGRQVVLRAPPRYGPQGQRAASVVLLAVVDAHSRFLMVEVGGFGRISDEGILESSVFGQALTEGKLDLPPAAPLPGAEHRGPQPYVFVADETLTLRTNVMRPFTGRLVAPEKRVFNQRLSRAQHTATDAFSRLASHWGLYRRPAEVRPEVAEQCVRATCLLHNFIMESGEVESMGEEEPLEEEGPLEEELEDEAVGEDEEATDRPEGEEDRRWLAERGAEAEAGAGAGLGAGAEASTGEEAGAGGAGGTEAGGSWRWRLRRLERGWAHRPSNEAMRVRDVFAEHFSAEGAVPWQNDE
ncbi:uncharacterized protein [Eucyclogobius newberryi]|uniref:uncharacterized protein n=1 Tax=Eucyclogobius newberryi TaxID=166745 RepID=UPI003B595E13